MKKLILILISSSLVVSAQAQQKSQQKSKARSKAPASVSADQTIQSELTHCRAQIADEAGHRGSTNQWFETAPTANHGRNFRTPTKVFGQWLEVKVSASGLPTLYQISNTSTTEVAYAANCTVSVKENLGMDFKLLESDKMAAWYDDAKLKADLSKRGPGLIYVWSPEMVYSAKYYKYFRDVAKKMKLKFIPVLDPRTKSSLVAQAEKEFAIAPSTVKLNSVELYMREVTVHYPSAVIFDHGKMHDKIIVGVMEPDALEQQVRIRLADLK